MDKTKPMLLTVKNNKLCLAQEGEQLVTLDEPNEYIIDAKENDDVLALFSDALGLIRRNDGQRWDGKEDIDTSLLARHEPPEENVTGDSVRSESS